MTKKTSRLTTFVMLITFILCLNFFADDVIISPEIKKAVRGTVIIFYLYNYQNAFGEKIRGTSRVSGIYVGKNRILSVYHVGDTEPTGGTFMAQMPDVGKTRKERLTVKKYDVKSGLALFEFGGLPPPIKPIEVAKDLVIGEDIMITGFSGMSNPRFGKLAHSKGNGILFHPAYYGDSGGGIFNMKGELLGIINSAWDSGMSKTVGHAIPLETIKKFLKDER